MFFWTLNINFYSCYPIIFKRTSFRKNIVEVIIFSMRFVDLSNNVYLVANIGNDVY